MDNKHTSSGPGYTFTVARCLYPDSAAVRNAALMIADGIAEDKLRFFMAKDKLRITMPGRPIDKNVIYRITL